MEPIELEDVRRLTLGPDDVLVVRFEGRISSDHMERLAYLLRRDLPHNNKVLILDAGASLDVLTPEQIGDLTATRT